VARSPLVHYATSECILGLLVHQVISVDCEELFEQLPYISSHGHGLLNVNLLLPLSIIVNLQLLSQLMQVIR